MKLFTRLILISLAVAVYSLPRPQDVASEPNSNPDNSSEYYYFVDPIYYDDLFYPEQNGSEPWIDSNNDTVILAPGAECFVPCNVTTQPCPPIDCNDNQTVWTDPCGCVCPECVPLNSESGSSES